MGLLPLGWQTVRLFTEYSAGKKKKSASPRQPAPSQLTSVSNWEEYTQQNPPLLATIRAAAADGSHSNQFCHQNPRQCAGLVHFSGVCFGLNLAQMKPRFACVSACGAAIMALTCPDVSPQSVGTSG